MLFGIVQIGVGIAARHLTQSVVNDALAIAGFSAGLLLGIFALGVLYREPISIGAGAGLLAGWSGFCWCGQVPWLAAIDRWPGPGFPRLDRSRRSHGRLVLGTLPGSLTVRQTMSATRGGVLTSSQRIPLGQTVAPAPFAFGKSWDAADVRQHQMAR